MVHIRPCAAKDDGVGRLIIAQHIDDGILAVVGRHGQGAIFNVAVLLFFASGVDPLGIALKVFGKRCNGPGNGGGKEQGTAFLWGCAEDGFEVFAEAQVQHLIRFVQDHRFEGGDVQGALIDVIDQPARRAHHNMRAAGQRPAFVAHVHAANAGCDRGPCAGVEPFQLPLNLEGQLPCGGDYQGQGRAGAGQLVFASQHGWA